MRRVRALTEQERALWAQVAATVTPRERPSDRRKRDASAEPIEGAAKPEAAQATPETVPAGPSTGDRRPQEASQKPPAPRVSLPPPLAPIERRLKQRLSRGQREVDAKIDLHGLRQEEAHAVLRRFILGAHARNAGLILVVTGKGGTKTGSRNAADDAGSFGFFRSERGVLNRLVPLWLSDPDLRRFVIGFEQASAAHGGSGALYVRIRRAKAH